MKKIADVKEISGTGSDPSIITRISAAEDVCKTKVLAYLKTGDITGTMENPPVDIFSQNKIDDPPFLYTDGEYEWSCEEIYYVTKYNLRLNDNFLRKIGIDGNEKHRRRHRYRDEWR